jgi:peptidoglycan-associated lipoprotein
MHRVAKVAGVFGLVMVGACAGTQDTARGTSQSPVAAAPAKPANPPPTLPSSSGPQLPDTAPLYFSLDSTVIGEADTARLREIAAYARAKPEVRIVLVGHADERGTSDYNLALGDARARSARDYLVRLGVDADRITFMSKGEEEPEDPGHDETAWAKNRRATFELRG